MPYVSAREVMILDEVMIVATDDQGREYTIPSMDSDVGAWRAFLDGGGTVDPYQPNIDQSVATAPEGLFSGPTLQELFHGND